MNYLAVGRVYLKFLCGCVFVNVCLGGFKVVKGCVSVCVGGGWGVDGCVRRVYIILSHLNLEVYPV